MITAAAIHYNLDIPNKNISESVAPKLNPLQKFANSSRVFFSKRVFKPFIIITALFFFQNWTGFIATIFFGVNIFQVFPFPKFVK